MKKKIVFGVALVGVMSLCGCTIREDINADLSDGNCNVTVKMGYDKASCTGYEGTLADEGYTLQTLDGEEYYMLTTSGTGSDFNEALSNASKDDSDTTTQYFVGSTTVTKDIVYLPFDSDQLDGSATSGSATVTTEGIKGVVSMTFNSTEDWVDTNGVLAEGNAKSVTFKGSSDDTTSIPSVYYAYTALGKSMVENDIVAPTITGLRSGKWYKAAPVFVVSDNVGVAYVRGNGKILELYTDTAGKTQWQAVDGKEWIKQGENTVVVTDIVGNTTSVTFKIDTKNVKVKGLKKSNKGKAVFYVKDETSGIKSVKFKGSKCKTTKVKKGKYKGYYKVTIKKIGSGTVKITDKAGNVYTKKIKIKKN